MTKHKPPVVIISDDSMKAQRDVSFFLRIHGHLPDGVCGTDALARCEYREDGRPINRRNDYVDQLRKDAWYRNAEKQVIEAQEKGVSIRIKKMTTMTNNNMICIFPNPKDISFGEGKDKNGKLWRWEFTKRFGPLFLRKDGEPLKNQPIRENHPAWEPFEKWQKETGN